MKMQIETGAHQPLPLKLYTILLAHISWLDEQNNTLIKVETIRHSTNLWSSQLVMVNAKEGGLRFWLQKN